MSEVALLLEFSGFSIHLQHSNITFKGQHDLRAIKTILLYPLRNTSLVWFVQQLPVPGGKIASTNVPVPT